MVAESVAEVASRLSGSEASDCDWLAPLGGRVTVGVGAMSTRPVASTPTAPPATASGPVAPAGTAVARPTAARAATAVTARTRRDRPARAGVPPASRTLTS